MLNVYKYQLIEVVLPGLAAPGNTLTTVIFPDQPYLRYKPIYGIEVINVNDMTLSPQGNSPLSTAQMKAAYLTLYLSDPDSDDAVGEWIQDVPLSTLHRTQNSAITTVAGTNLVTPDPFVRLPFLMVGQKISWEKCKFILPQAFGNTANVSFLLGVYFREKAATK
jgi:hypothetical protein